MAAINPTTPTPAAIDRPADGRTVSYKNMAIKHHMSSGKCIFLQ
jgi:hypothetical protein